MSDQSPFEANAYAVTYRLLGDAPAAHAAAHAAVGALDRARQRGDAAMLSRHWLYTLTDLAVTEAVASPAAMHGVDASRSAAEPATRDDPSAGLRAALRRRLINATPDERVAGALVHLAGYPTDFVAEVLGTTAEVASSASAVLAPPPGVDYRELGDPTLTGNGPTRAKRRDSRVRRPHWTTIAAVAIVAAAVIAATQVTGPRPTLGPPLDEGGAAAVELPGQRNGDPLTQATND